MKNKDTTCVLAWASIRVWPEGRVSPCCLNTIPARHSNGEEMYLYKDSIKDAFSSADFQSLRTALKNGEKDPRCMVCWNREAAGLESKREQENSKYPDLLEKISKEETFEQPVILDLNIGTTCNLKCRSCGANSSSKWATELVELYNNDYIARNNNELKEMPAEESRKRLSFWYDYSKDFWSTLKEWAPKIKVWFFAGGEPLLNKSHLGVLQTAIDEDVAHKQAISYVTNGTIKPSELMRDTWKKFSLINFAMSADGIGKKFEYLRHGAKWDEFLINFDLIQSTCTNPSAMVVNFTCSIFNILSIPESMEFFLQKNIVISLTFVDFAERFCIQSMPRTLKDKVAEKLYSDSRYQNPQIREFIDCAISYMNIKEQPEHWNDFLVNVPIHDSYRKESFSKTFPELSELIDSLDLFRDHKEKFISNINPSLAT